VPLALVPTTTGTGAECTRIAMLAGGVGKRIISHRHLVPLVAVLDVDLVIGLPPSVTAATGMDALAHATESFLSTSSTVLTAAMGLRAVELLVEWLPVAVAEPDHRPARRATLYGAYLAGLALNAGVLLGHSMAYTVANRAHLAHGVTCAMALPFCLAYNAAGDVDGTGDLAQRLTGGASRELRDAAECLLELNTRFDVPATPAAAGIPDSEVEPMARECAEVYPRPTNPVPMTVERLTPLYRAWFRLDLAGVWAG
jgi:alcohol dehydrogenase class IV